MILNSFRNSLPWFLLVLVGPHWFISTKTTIFNWIQGGKLNEKNKHGEEKMPVAIHPIKWL
jgi:hypothetical protein